MAWEADQGLRSPPKRQKKVTEPDADMEDVEKENAFQGSPAARAAAEALTDLMMDTG